MQRYRVIDGAIVQGDTPREVCEALRESTIFLRDQTLEEYLAGYAERVKDFDGFNIRAWTPEDFLEDLLERSLITKLEE